MKQKKIILDDVAKCIKKYEFIYLKLNFILHSPTNWFQK